MDTHSQIKKDANNSEIENLRKFPDLQYWGFLKFQNICTTKCTFAPGYIRTGWYAIFMSFTVMVLCLYCVHHQSHQGLYYSRYRGCADRVLEDKLYVVMKVLVPG